MNFGRIVRMTIRYKFTFAASIFSALMVAVLWGANIGPVYPIIEIVLKNKPMQQWIDEQIQENRTTIAAESVKLERWHKELAAVEKSGDKTGCWEIQQTISTTENEIASAKTHLRSSEFAKPYIDAYLPHDPFHTLLLITGLLLVGTVVKDLFLVANNLLVARLSQHTIFDLRKLFYRRTLRMDLATFGEDGTADLMSRFTNDMSQVAGGLDSLFGKLVREPLKMLACLAVAAFISWRLLLLTLFITPVAAFSIRWLAKMLKRANRRAMEDMAVIYTTLEETFRSIKIVKAFTNEPQERKRFHDNNKRYYHKAMKIARYDSLSHPMTEVMGIATVSMVMIVGGWLIFSPEPRLFWFSLKNWQLSQAAMLTFFAMLAGMADPLRKMSDIFSNLQSGFAAADRIFARLDREPKIRDPKQPAPFHRHCRDLTFENVGFAYQPGKPVVEEVESADRLRRDPGHCRPERLRQEHAGQSDSAFRRSDRRRGEARRRAAGRHAAAEPSRPDRTGHAGNDALRRHDFQQYPLRRGLRHPRAGRRGRQARPCPSLHRAGIAQRLRNVGRRVGQLPVGRAAPANRPGQGHPPRSRHSDPRRSDQSGRFGERAGDSTGVGNVHARPHHDSHHAPLGCSIAGRSNRGDARRADSRRGPPRRTAHPLQSLPSALSNPLRGFEADGVRVCKGPSKLQAKLLSAMRRRFFAYFSPTFVVH